MITHGCARLLAAAVLGAVIVGPLHDVAVASDLANHHAAAMDANAHTRPIRMLLRVALRVRSSR